MRRIIPVLFLSCIGLIVGCVTTGPGGKSSFIIIPSSQEAAIGQGMADEIAASEKVLGDVVWQAYVNEVGQKIVAVCDRHDIEYRFTVIESDQINAFAAPGGYVYFYTGLLREMDNEAELAAVMAHEISHVVARHSVKRLQTAMGVSLAYDLATGGESSQAVDLAVGIGMNLLFADFSRDDEREADDFAMTYMVRAGYNPQAMITMFDKLAAMGGPSNAFEKLISTHPESQERIRNARDGIARRQPLPNTLTLGVERYRRMLTRLPAETKG